MSESSPQQRNAETTRKRILAAAQRRFSKQSFDATGMREIAAEAGVNVALVNRYFGSKEQLFEEAVAEAITIDALLAGPQDGFGTRTASAMLSKDFKYINLDPTAAFVNSLGSPVVGERLRRAVEERLLPEISGWLGGAHADQRAAMIFSALLGFDVLRRMARIDALNTRHGPVLEDLCAATLQSYVDGAPDTED